MRINFIILVVSLFFLYPHSAQSENCDAGDCRNGFGVARQGNGTSYIGYWKDGKYHGYGVLRLSQGSGELKGSIYEGEFAEGRFNGSGRLTLLNGKIEEGAFHNGVFLGEKDGGTPPTVVQTPSVSKPQPASTPRSLDTPPSQTARNSSIPKPQPEAPAPAPITPVRENPSAEVTLPAKTEPVTVIKTPSVNVKTGTVQKSSTPGGPAGKYPEGSTRKLVLADLQGKSRDELHVMRNEIYARHSYIFKSTALSKYFQQQSWYQPLYSDVSAKLSKTEIDNFAFIKNHEKTVD